MADADGEDWDIRVEGGTAVVELPRRLTLDRQAGDRMHEAFRDVVLRHDVDRVLLLLDVEHPLSAGLHDVVEKGAQTAVENGVTDWAIVAEHASKGVALEREITGVETAVFDDEREARKRST